MTETILKIIIRPGVAPNVRHQIEDELMNKGLDVDGGGGYVDGSESDIILYSTNVDVDLPVMIDVLRMAKVGQASYIMGDGNLQHPVYDENAHT